MPFDLDRLAARLAARSSKDPLPLGQARAAVAALLRWERGEPEVLLMQRAHFDGDRWSGQVAMPGGREEPGDADLVATARRETLEELGIDLDRSARLLGRLDAVQAIARGAIIPLTITPIVFVQTGPVEIAMNHEVARWFWFPLGAAARGELDTRYTWRLGPVPMTMPGWRHDVLVVWGLTYRMLRDLIAVAD